MDDLDQRERADKVSAACRWYRGNVEIIRSMLPLWLPLEGYPRGVSWYPENWCPLYWINKWESKDNRFTLEEAEQMISEQLRPLFPLVRDRMGANPGK
jgi:hypothetical protein